MSSPLAKFEQYEDKFQEKFEDIKLPYEPCSVVKVELLGFRNISVGWSDYVDTPDPKFHVTCLALEPGLLRTLKTQTIPSNVTSGFVGETFKFVLPKSLQPGQNIPIEIELYDKDLVRDDFIGKQTVEASNLPEDGTPVSKTLIFDKTHGELDIKISKFVQTSPDFRYSIGLCSEEKAFRKKRIPKVYEAMKKLFGDKAPRNPTETPVVSLVGSGGGYRAVVGMCGAMEALNDAGLLDMFTYNCGLSGSSWYLACAYALEGVKASEQKEFHKKIRERMNGNLILQMANPLTVKAYEEHVAIQNRRLGLPYTFANYFPGYMVGRELLKTEMEKTLSSMVPYVENADVPYPLLVALHVKNHLKASKYHAYLERTPYEISLPAYGISIKPKNEGAAWKSGVLVKEYPEIPVHFTIAMTGCAFSIMLNSFLNKTAELNETFVDYIEEERLAGKKKAKKDLEETNRFAEIESSDEDEDDDKDEDDDNDLLANIIEERNIDHPLSKEAKEAFTGSLTTAGASASKKNEEISTLGKIIRATPFFSTRNAVIGRTARLFNVALGLEKVEHYSLNPFGIREHDEGTQAAHLINVIHKKPPTKRCISTKKDIICYVDAGVLKNVPTDVVLRPQRTTDLMIVMDFNAYNSDEYFNYQPLLSAAAHAWLSGLEFPYINFKEITNLPPKDFLIFPSHGPNCPTVLWFTLSNTNFKNVENYKPRSTANPPGGETRKFNDFPVFSEGTQYSTYNFRYSGYHFDQLSELMYFNVMSHVEEIKEAIVEATVRKRENLKK